jgi:electron transport complex protein RnfD
VENKRGKNPENSMSKLILTSAPHIQSKAKLNRIMYDVVIALLPAAIFSIYLFGYNSLYVILLTIASSLLFEAAILWIRKKEHIVKTTFDGSVLITGLLLALNLPPGSPFWLILAGSFIAVVVTKHTFGGLGYNIFNPALVARVFLLISFPVQMTKWLKPAGFTDAVTTTTPLNALRLDGGEKVSSMFTFNDLFMGTTAGSIGEISAAALLLGAVYMLARKVITWEIPLSLLGTLFAFTGVFWLADPQKYASPVFHLFSGGAILGAFYMATDMVTSPVTRKGMLIFGFFIGLITALIRLFGAYPEGISFAIIIMNAFVPLIDKYTEQKKFGLKQVTYESAKN